MIGGYVRVSSASQDAGMQRDAILRAATARGEAVVRWYSDVKSGATLERPQLAKLRRDVREGRVRKLYVYRLDRLGRGGIRETLELVGELRAHGCAVATIADGFDVDGPAAEIVLAVIAWGAQMEREAIRERLAEARARAKERGEPWGRRPRMSRAQIKDARAQHEMGKSIREIAVSLKVPKSTVLRAVNMPSHKLEASAKVKPARNAARQSRKPPPVH